jgi:MFS family permease
VAWVDRSGRKPLLFIGTKGMGLITLVALVVFIACFAFSLGPIAWTIINEIFPSRVRGEAVAVATAANWFAA